MILNKEFQKDEELEFNVYGFKAKGLFIHLKDRVFKIKVTYDETEVTDLGCTANVHQSFLINKD